MSHRTHQRKALFAGIVGASALLIGVPAGAQQQNVTSLGIEEMVVTSPGSMCANSVYVPP